MAFNPTYRSKPWDYELQDFQNRMSKAFSWSQPYVPSSKELESAQRSRFREAMNESTTPKYNVVGEMSENELNALMNQKNESVLTERDKRRKQLEEMGLL